jgi:hypothetical protein
MDTLARRGSFWGMVLIVLGAALLLERLHILGLGFSTIFWPLMMLLGIVWVARGFTLNRKGAIFWGTVLFLYALFFFLRSIESLQLYGHLFPAATFLVFGAAFLMVFVNDVQDWYFLIPALLLMGLGFLLVVSEYGYIYRWEVWEALRLYWPVVLVLFGLGILLRRSSRKTHPPEGTS